MSLLDLLKIDENEKLFVGRVSAPLFSTHTKLGTVFARLNMCDTPEIQSPITETRSRISNSIERLTSKNIGNIVFDDILLESKSILGGLDLNDPNIEAKSEKWNQCNKEVSCEFDLDKVSENEYTLSLDPSRCKGLEERQRDTAQRSIKVFTRVHFSEVESL